MADRVFLHVGAPKSGTSYLQRILWSNRDRLAADGYLLPGTRRAQYALMGDLRGAPWQDPDSSWTWDRLAERVRAHHGSVVVSEEMLGAATNGQAESAVRRLAPAEVHVVVAVRDLGRTIPSAWQQSVRARAVGGYASFVEGLQTGRNPGFWATQSAVPILDRWTSLVPPERRHVVTVPPQGSDRTLLWERFAVALGLDATRYEVGEPAGNPSLGAPEAELLRRVNRALGEEYPLSRPYLGTVRRHLTLPVLMANPAPVRFAAPPDVAAWVSERSAAIVQELRAYPCQVVGDLSDLLRADVGDSVSPDDYDAEALLALAVDTMVGMLRHTDREVTALEETVVEQRRRIRRLEHERAPRAAAARRALRRPWRAVRDVARA
jgi:hypothetical protein